MRTFWCVTSSYDDKGKVTANITATTEAEECPKPSFRSMHNRDIYCDWFDSAEKAAEFVKQKEAA